MVLLEGKWRMVLGAYPQNWKKKKEKENSGCPDFDGLRR